MRTPALKYPFSAQPLEKRAVPVDRAGLERGELGETGRIAGQKAAEVHELGEAEHLRVIGQRKKVADIEPGARRLEARRRNAARKLNPKVHRGRHGAVEEVAQARRTEHVADLMRIADRRRHPVPQDATVELERRDERQLDMAMRVDEAGNDDLSPHVDLARAAIFAHRADDAVVADGDVACDEFAGHEIEDPPSLEDDVGLGEPLALLDRARKVGDGVAHARFPVETAAIVSALAGPLKQEFPDPAPGDAASGAASLIGAVADGASKPAGNMVFGLCKHEVGDRLRVVQVQNGDRKRRQVVRRSPPQ